ncbi:MAG: ABC transporter substrate-binding protein, partial [Halomonas sp.]|nr:ABC transporter substrate-binding protein [Halomonas sp.]
MPPADPTAPPKLVAAGHAELALTSQPRLHLLVEKGLPLIRVGTLVPLPLATLLVRQDTGIDSLEKLKGHSVGYVFEAPARLLLGGLLQNQAITLDEVTLQPVDFALNRMLAEGEVDAVVGARRHVTRQAMIQQGIDVSEFHIQERDLPVYEELILVANRQTLGKHRRDIVRVLDAIESATRWITENPDQAWEVVREAEPGLDTEANAQAWPSVLRYLALRPAALQLQRYQEFETYLLQRGLIDTDTPARRLATDLTRP